MPSIFDVAEYFLHLASGETENSITPLKLQKLCYYAQAWSLVWDGEPLFDEDFQAWAHGPANPSLFNRYRSHRWGIIPGETMSIDSIEKTFTQDQLETMDVIWQDYGIYDGKYLEVLTHREDPWKLARGTCTSGESCSNIISKDSMAKYYARALMDG